MKKATLLFFTVVIIVLILLLARFYYSGADFGLTNPYWNGISQMSGDIKPVYGMSGLSTAGPNSTLLIIKPRVDITDNESEAVLSFLHEGGRVIVLDDYGCSNSLLINIGSSVMLVQVPLCQEGDYYKKQSFPVIKKIYPSSITVNVTSLVFNHPVPLNISGDAMPFAETSGMGWLDENDDCRIDNGEPYGIFTLAASARYGKGELLVIGDPDILINSMLDKGDNQALISNILEPGTTYVDLSHGQDLTPVGKLIYILKEDMFVQLLCILLILLSFFGIYWLRHRAGQIR